MRTIMRKVDKTGAEWTVRKMMDFHKQHKYILDNAVQRGFVWKKDKVKMSQFIFSLIIERPIPPIYVAKIDGIYSAMDGKQRTTTIDKYMNDEFPLEGLEPLEIYDDETGEVEEVDINTLYFSELEEAIQNAIKDSTITVIVINNPTEEEICEYFYYLNNGVPMDSATSSRTKAKSRAEIAKLAGHELFKEVLTQEAIENHVNDALVIKSYAMLHEEEPSFDKKSIDNLFANVEITEEDTNQLNKVFDRIVAMHSVIEDGRVAKRIFVRTHTISIIPIVWRSIQEGRSDRQIAEWFSVFFNGSRSTTISALYNSNARGSTGKKSAIKRRVSELSKSYENYFKVA